MKNQKNAVCDLLLSTLVERDAPYDSDRTMKEQLTAEDKATVRAQVTQGFLNGEISMSDAAQIKYLSNPTELNKYVNGLVNNWINKNPDFNMGAQYKAKNPGSRAGQGDDQVRAMRALKKTTNDIAVIAEIDKAIATRLAEIKPATIEINVDALPEHLKHLV